jgi:hypothetical protein
MTMLGLRWWMPSRFREWGLLSRENDCYGRKADIAACRRSIAGHRKADIQRSIRCLKSNGGSNGKTGA